jgi:hypothetical protein
MISRKLYRCLACLTVFVLAAPIACESDDGDDSMGDGDTSDSNGDGDAGDGDPGDGDGDTGDGTTDCTPPGLPDPVTCQAGQYCADPVLAMCENGCLSNANCLPNQICEKQPGIDVGTCQNMAAEGPTEQEFCDKLLACDPAGTMEQCSMFYAGTNETCHQCIVDGNCGDINLGSCGDACGL